MSRDWVPQGLGLDALRALVAEDLVPDDALAEVAGPRVDVAKSEIPRIRPILVALAARSVGASRVDEEAQHAAEMLHLALHIHDLALGREGGRRRRVARSLVRRSVNWLAGNHLTLRALELSQLAGPGVLEELMEALRSFSDAQERSRELVGHLPHEPDWLDHADGHTGALFAFCCRVGGHIAGAPIGQVCALGRYGRHVGRLWHVAEDVSGLLLGDAVAHLQARAAVGRPVLPVIYAAEHDPEIARAWSSLHELDDARTAQLARRIVGHGLVPSRRVVLRESWIARKALAGLPDTPYRRGMDRLVTELTKTFTQEPRPPRGPRAPR